MSRPLVPDLKPISSTALKTQLGEMIDRAGQGESFRIQRHGRDAGVLLSARTYEALIACLPDPLRELQDEFDALVARMADPEAAAEASERMSESTPEELGEAAVQAARGG